MSEDVKPARKKRKFKSGRKEEVVEIDGKEYKLVEMGGDELSEWMAYNADRMKFDTKGNPTGMKAAKNLHEKLIMFCLKDLGNNVPPATTIAKLGATDLRDLFTICQEMNGLTEDSKESEKKD